MRKYEVVAAFVVDDFVWSVYEKATEQIIDSFFFEDDALETIEFYEEGGGFNGFTPSFMLIPIPDPDMNAKFERLMA